MRTYAVSKAVQISATGFEPLEEQKKIPASELPIAPLDFGVISSSAVWLFEWALPLYTPLSPPPAGQVIHSTGRARLLAEGGRVPPGKKGAAGCIMSSRCWARRGPRAVYPMACNARLTLFWIPRFQRYKCALVVQLQPKWLQNDRKMVLKRVYR